MTATVEAHDRIETAREISSVTQVVYSPGCTRPHRFFVIFTTSGLGPQGTKLDWAPGQNAPLDGGLP